LKAYSKGVTGPQLLTHMKAWSGLYFLAGSTCLSAAVTR
jgi:hypothetical protein